MSFNEDTYIRNRRIRQKTVFLEVRVGLLVVVQFDSFIAKCKCMPKI